MKRASSGLAFASVTGFIWGAEPLLFQSLLSELSPTLVCWIRLVGAFPLFYLLARRAAPEFKPFKPPPLAWLCGLLLGSNYYFFLRGIEISGPASATILLQSGALLFAILGWIVFREKLRFRAVFGIGLATIGYGLYYYVQTEVGAPFGKGELLVLLSATSWAFFACLQRKLLSSHNPDVIMAWTFAIAAIVIFLPLDVQEIAKLTLTNWSYLIVAVFATFLTYYCFSQATLRVSIAKISAILALNPIVTLVLLNLREWLGGESAPSHSPIAYLGVSLCVLGISFVVSRDAGAPDSVASAPRTFSAQ